MNPQINKKRITLPSVPSVAHFSRSHFSYLVTEKSAFQILPNSAYERENIGHDFKTKYVTSFWARKIPQIEAIETILSPRGDSEKEKTYVNSIILTHMHINKNNQPQNNFEDMEEKVLKHILKIKLDISLDEKKETKIKSKI